MIFTIEGAMRLHGVQIIMATAGRRKEDSSGRFGKAENKLRSLPRLAFYGNFSTVRLHYFFADGKLIPEPFVCAF